MLKASRIHASAFRIAFLAGALHSPCALSYDWSALAATCADTKLAGFDQFITDASAWEVFQTKTQGEIQTLTDQTCPTYLQSANGAMGMGGEKKMTLEEYIADHTHTFSDAGDSTGRGRKHTKYLSDTFTFTASVHAKYGFDFGADPCGSGMMGAKKHITEVLATIESKSAAAGKICAGLADKIAAQGPDPNRPRLAYGQGSVLTGESANSESTITGHKDEAHYAPLGTEQLVRAMTFGQTESKDTPSTLTSNAPGNASGNPFAAGASPGPETGAGSAHGAGSVTASVSRAPAAATSSGAMEAAGVSGTTSFRAAGVNAEERVETETAASATSGFFPERLATSTGRATTSLGSAPEGLANSEPVPVQNEDRSRFLRDFAAAGANAEKAHSYTLFELVSHRYRLLSAGLR